MIRGQERRHPHRQEAEGKYARHGRLPISVPPRENCTGQRQSYFPMTSNWIAAELPIGRWTRLTQILGQKKRQKYQ